MDEGARRLIEKGEAETNAGKWDSASEVLTEALSMLEGVEDKEGKSYLSKGLRLKALVDCRRGMFTEGLNLAKMGMDTSRSIEDLEGEADAIRLQGYIYWRKGDSNMALEFLDAALEMAELAGARRVQGRTMLDKASALAMVGDRAKAVTVLKEAANLLEEVGDLPELARAYNNLGSCYVDMERFNDAIDTFKLCMYTADRFGNLVRKGWGAMNTAACYTKMGEPERAREFLAMAMEHLERTGDRMGIAVVLLESGLAHTALREWREAEDDLEKALEMFEGLGTPAYVALGNMSLGDYHNARGNRMAAREFLEKARETYERIGMPNELAQVKDKLRALDED